MWQKRNDTEKGKAVELSNPVSSLSSGFTPQQRETGNNSAATKTITSSKSKTGENTSGENRKKGCFSVESRAILG